MSKHKAVNVKQLTDISCFHLQTYHKN